MLKVKSKLLHVSQNGFTLIELVVVFAVIGIMSALGIASLASYGNKQSLETAALNVADMVNLARARSLSQVKPSECGTNTLTGYQIDITIAANQYALSVQCTNSYTLVSEKLPANISFASSSATTVLFPLLTGGSSSYNQIIINGYGANKIININNTGNVSIQ